MISAARGHCSAAHAACTGPFEFLCPPVSVLDQAFMILIELSAYAFSPVIAHNSACVYAAALSRCSSLQPRSGLEYGPHSTVSRGLGAYESDPYGLVLAASNADFHGSLPAATLALISSSCARL